MGLMICQKIIERCKGTLTVNSKGENQGTQFAFAIKMTQVEDDNPRIFAKHNFNTKSASLDLPQLKSDLKSDRRISKLDTIEESEPLNRESNIMHQINSNSKSNTHFDGSDGSLFEKSSETMINLKANRCL